MSFIPLDIEKSRNIPRYFWHPSVVYIPEGFGGHKWWMAQTPYHPLVDIKPYQSRWELPCVYWSEDGIRWKSIPYNPVDDLTPEQIYSEDYLSDTHLVYHEGILELYYRLSLLKDKKLRDNKTLLFKRTSLDGIHWSSRKLIVDLRDKNDVSVWGEQVISPSIIWDGTQYLCWYVDSSSYIPQKRIRMISSSDGTNWGNSTLCKLIDYTDMPWHIDVQKIDGTYYLLCYGDKNRTLSLLTSIDGITWKYPRTILTASGERFSFYSDYIYRSCLVCKEDQFLIFFSGANRIRSYIGLLGTKDWKKFTPIYPRINYWYTIDIIRLVVFKITNKIVKIFKHNDK